MVRHAGLSQWEAVVSTAFPHLSRPFARGLAWWSFGMAQIRGCGRRSVAMWFAFVLQIKVTTVEQRLYEWCVDATHKAGRQRRTLDITTCFAPLLAWVIRLWSGTQLALTLDATPLRDRFTCLTVSVVYRGNAIPVAWTILHGNHRHAWNPEWIRMLGLLQGVIPAAWTVLVLTDRGLWSPTIYRAIQAQGWHPFMRIRRQGLVRPCSQSRFVAPDSLVTPQQPHWRGRVRAFKDTPIARQLDTTLLVWTSAQHAEPWCILTDLAPTACNAAWYALRAWCEQGFKSTKRGMWQWQQTQMRDPARAERLWLALAVASLWLISVGSAVEDAALDGGSDLPALTGLWESGRRVLRLLRLGWLWLHAQQVNGQPLPLPERLIPDPWPLPRAIGGAVP